MITGSTQFWNYPRRYENRGRPRKYTLVSDPAREFNPGLAFYEDEAEHLLKRGHFTMGTILKDNDGMYAVREYKQGQRLVKL